MKINDLTLLDIFTRTHRLGSFSKAGASLGLSQSTVSKKIQQLESQLQVTLFQRTTRRLHLTEAGQSLLDSAERIFSEVHQLEASLGQEANSRMLEGSLRISCPETYANARLVSVIGEFQKLHPLVKIELILTNSFLNLIEENLDVAIRIYKPRDSSLKSFKLEDNSLVLCASPEYLRKHGRPRKLSQLTKHAVGYLSMHASERFERSGVSVEQACGPSALQVNSGETINQWCRQGFGLALRSLWDVQRYFRDGSLEPLDLGEPISSHTGVYALFSARAHLPRKTRVFLDYLKDSFAQI